MNDNRIKLIVGHAVGCVCVLGLLVGIAKIAIGHVEEATSYGLMPLIVALSNLCVMYGNWAWSKETQNGRSERSETGRSLPSTGSQDPPNG